MTEAEWRASVEPQRMVAHLDTCGVASGRKLRLLGVALCMGAGYSSLGKPFRRCVAIAEQSADGYTNETKLQAAYASIYIERPEGFSDPVGRCIGYLTAPTFSARSAESVLELTGLKVAPGQVVVLVRDIFGNPFRPVSADPSWLTSTVVSVARGIYDDRAFDRLPILADALQDAGCENADVLAHCRGPEPHVRGCWVVDLVLGKS